MFEHPHMFGCPSHIWMAQNLGVSVCPQYICTPPCLDTLHMCGCPLYIHNTKKACFVRLRWCPYTPIHLDASICWDAPCMFGCHPYVWTPPVCLNAPKCLDAPPICLDAPCMFGCPLHVWMPPMFQHHPYVWMPPVCLDTPICLNIPHMFGCSPECLDVSICLDTPVCLDTSCMFG